MLQVTHNEADRILLDMADEAEAAREYDQRSYGLGCGTPACMLGTYGWNHPTSIAGRYVIHSEPGVWAQLHAEFGMSDEEYDEIFGIGGCGGALRDGKRAAAYVREFVRKRALARIAA